MGVRRRGTLPNDEALFGDVIEKLA